MFEWAATTLSWIASVFSLKGRTARNNGPVVIIRGNSNNVVVNVSKTDNEQHKVEIISPKPVRLKGIVTTLGSASSGPAAMSADAVKKQDD